MKKLLLIIMLFSFIGCSNLSNKNKKVLNGKEYIMVNQRKDIKISIGFTEDNFFGFSGVNHYFGKYKISGERIKFSNVAVTLMLGDKEMNDMEVKYIKDIEKVIKYKIIKDKLVLITSDNKEIKFYLY